MTRLYHTTTAEAARSILHNGFRDAEGNYGFDLDEPMRGVFFCDQPVGINEVRTKGDPALGDPVLVLDIPEEEIAEYGWPDAVREWCIPAENAKPLRPAEGALDTGDGWRHRPRLVDRSAPAHATTGSGRLDEQ
jgi:hypothetical protein